jgi:hypothetical protein
LSSLPRAALSPDLWRGAAARALGAGTAPRGAALVAAENADSVSREILVPVHELAAWQRTFLRAVAKAGDR